MLVLSRKIGERIRLGPHITVEIIRVAGNRVRLGIVAPPDVIVVRDELPPLAVHTPEKSPPREEAA